MSRVLDVTQYDYNKGRHQSNLFDVLKPKLNLELNLRNVEELKYFVMKGNNCDQHCLSLELLIDVTNGIHLNFIMLPYR